MLSKRYILMLVCASIIWVLLGVDLRVNAYIFTGLGVILAGWVFLFLHRGFVPVLRISIEPKWVDGCGEMVILRVTIQNMSRVAARMKDACVQIIDYDKPKPGCFLSEWVPLEWDRPKEAVHSPPEKSNIRELWARLKKVFEAVRDRVSPKSPPDRVLDYARWNERKPKAKNRPRKILATTKKIEAGESIHVDFLYPRPQNVVSHFLVQVRAELDPITRWVLDLQSDSWTATAWLVGPEVLARANVQCQGSDGGSAAQSKSSENGHTESVNREAASI